MIDTVQVTKYGDSIESSDNWVNPEEALAQEDGICAYVNAAVVNEFLVIVFDCNIPAAAIIEEVLVSLKVCCNTARGENMHVRFWDGSQWSLTYDIGQMGFACVNTVYLTDKDMTSFFDTVAKVNAAKFKIKALPAGSPPGFPEQWTHYCDAVRMKVTYSLPAAAKRLTANGFVCVVS